MPNTKLRIADREFSSRLIIGTGKYRSFQEMATVAVRWVNVTDRNKESLLDYIDTKKFFIMPNTAGCYTADEAIRNRRASFTSKPPNLAFQA